MNHNDYVQEGTVAKSKGTPTTGADPGTAELGRTDSEGEQVAFAVLGMKVPNPFTLWSSEPSSPPVKTPDSGFLSTEDYTHTFGRAEGNGATAQAENGRAHSLVTIIERVAGLAASQEPNCPIVSKSDSGSKLQGGAPN